jgi:hypothetical protein
MIGNKLVFILVAVITLALATGVLTYYQAPHATSQTVFRLELTKTGGIAGVNDTLVIKDNGLATLTSKYGVSFNRTLGAVEFSELKYVIARNLDSVSPRTLQAKAGAADYFGYRLLVTTDTRTTEIFWVDQWAVNGTFPEGLKAIQSEVQKLTVDLTARQSFVNTNSSEMGGLRMTILADKSDYKVGEQVNFVVILENTGSSNVTYTSPTPCNQDARVVVSNGSTTQDVTGNESAVCIQVLQGRTLQANTYIVQSGAWDITLDRNGNRIAASPGTYTISAVFPYASFEKTLLGSSVKIAVAL